MHLRYLRKFLKKSNQRKFRCTLLSITFTHLVRITAECLARNIHAALIRKFSFVFERAQYLLPTPLTDLDLTIPCHIQTANVCWLSHQRIQSYVYEPHKVKISDINYFIFLFRNKRLIYSGRNGRGIRYSLGNGMELSRFKEPEYLDVSNSTANDDCMRIVATHCPLLK